jgi:hypothetical protein
MTALASDFSIEGSGAFNPCMETEFPNTDYDIVID